MELNKIAGAILLAGLIAMIAGKTSEILYYGGGHHGDDAHATRGYEIAVVEGDDTGAVKEEKIEQIAAFLPDADVTAGEAFFQKRCATCHNVEKGAGNKIGPELYAILDRDIGAFPDFKYSDALATHGGKWTYQDLSEFLTKPKKWAPGTIMAYAGIKKPEERANVILYMRSLGKESTPLPPVPVVEEAAPAEEQAAAGEKL